MLLSCEFVAKQNGWKVCLLEVTTISKKWYHCLQYLHSQIWIWVTTSSFKGQERCIVGFGQLNKFLSLNMILVCWCIAPHCLSNLFLSFFNLGFQLDKIFFNILAQNFSLESPLFGHVQSSHCHFQSCDCNVLLTHKFRELMLSMPKLNVPISNLRFKFNYNHWSKTEVDLHLRILLKLLHLGDYRFNAFHSQQAW